MSRSYKKHPCINRKPEKGLKKASNKAVRRAQIEDIVSHKKNGFKRIFNSLRIAAFKEYPVEFNSYFNLLQNSGSNISKAEAYKTYMKYYKSK